jgi:hypothetical protein
VISIGTSPPPSGRGLDLTAAASRHCSRIGGVENGFPEPTDLARLAESAEYQPDAIRDNFGLDPAVAMRSLELFITDVMPHFSEPAAVPGSAHPTFLS